MLYVLQHLRDTAKAHSEIHKAGRYVAGVFETLELAIAAAETKTKAIGGWGLEPTWGDGSKGTLINSYYPVSNSTKRVNVWYITEINSLNEFNLEYDYW